MFVNLLIDQFAIFLDTNSNKVVTYIYALIDGVKVAFPGATPKGDVKVPINSGSTVAYSNSITVLPSYPKVR